MAYLTILSIIIGPVFAVAITLWHQNNKEKRRDKMNLFSTLMMHRKSFPIREEWVNALNLIDVVFHADRKVVGIWHEYHDMLYRKDRDFDGEGRKYLDMISEMAKSLGYNYLKQTDIDRFYSPIGLGEQKDLYDQLQKEQLKYLKNSNKLYAQETTKVSKFS